MPDPLTIAATAWAWDKYGKSLTDKAATALKGRWDKFRWSDAAERYRTKVKKLYGTMQIMGMAEPVPLDDIFTEAYLLDKPTAFSRFDIERLTQASADPGAPPPNAKRVTGLSLVKGNRNLFILGKPGAGKTTFLKYIAVQAAEPKKPVIDKVPVFVSLKQWADSGKELLPFLQERFDICDFPEAGPFAEELLKSGGAIVLFDGLDEVNQDEGRRDRQTGAINNFIEKYDRTQCLITCRIAASDYSFKPFTYVEIADFTPEQIATFVGNWFRNQEGEKDEETSKRFLAEFKRDDNKGLRDLARTPLLLTLLCLSFNETLTFPQRRVEIYKEALDALLKKWDSTRKIKRDEIYRKLSLGHKENMLARIAAETFEKNQYFIPQRELERLITNYAKNVPPHDTNETTDGEIILKAIEAQHGIFVERAREIYSFSHLTFQEYFTAQYIVDNASKGTLTTLLRKHCADKRWREVFLLTTSLLPDAAQFIKDFRQAIDKFLEGDNELQTAFEWVDKKASSVKAGSWGVRLLYLSFVIPVPHNFDGAHILDELRSNVALDSALNRACSNVLESDRTRSFRRACKLAHEFGLEKLKKELDDLLLPADETARTEWQKFAGNVRAIAIRHRDVGHEWELTDIQTVRLNNYLNAAGLLHDCLDLAFMSLAEKEKIRNNLYLPPA